MWEYRIKVTFQVDKKLDTRVMADGFVEHVIKISVDGGSVKILEGKVEIDEYEVNSYEAKEYYKKNVPSSSKSSTSSQ